LTWDLLHAGKDSSSIVSEIYDPANYQAEEPPLEWKDIKTFIKSLENLKLMSYAVTSGGKPHIGYGHTGFDVEIGQLITMKKALALFEEDFAHHEKGVRELVKVTLN
jgi:hypothetical protein